MKKSESNLGSTAKSLVLRQMIKDETLDLTNSNTPPLQISNLGSRVNNSSKFNNLDSVSIEGGFNEVNSIIGSHQELTQKNKKRRKQNMMNAGFTSLSLANTDTESNGLPGMLKQNSIQMSLFSKTESPEITKKTLFADTVNVKEKITESKFKTDDKKFKRKIIPTNRGAEGESNDAGSPGKKARRVDLENRATKKLSKKDKLKKKSTKIFFVEVTPHLPLSTVSSAQEDTVSRGKNPLSKKRERKIIDNIETGWNPYTDQHIYHPTIRSYSQTVKKEIQKSKLDEWDMPGIKSISPKKKKAKKTNIEECEDSWNPFKCQRDYLSIN